jgi:sugar transferase (PEP-CTERM/EpsH1 system associated)
MRRPLNITHVVLAMDVGGLERVILNLVREGLRLGQRVTVLCLERAGGLAADAEAAGAMVRSLEKPPGLAPRVIVKIWRALRNSGTDVVHTHQIGALFYAGIGARLAGIPVVVHTEHGSHYDHAPSRTRWLARMASACAQRFFCVSADIAAGVVAARVAPASKVAVIANGIEVARFADPGEPAAVRRSFGIPPMAPVVGTVGNLREVKRQDVLLRGFARLSGGDKAGELPHLLIVGDGPLRDDLVRLAGELGIADRVHFAGRRTDPECLVPAMDVFALTSRSEGMPLAILEAWAAGRAVVASNVGGVPELIDDGQTGLLFPVGDDAALARQMSRLLEDPALARRLGSAGRDAVRQRYDVTVMADAYLGHYKRLLGHGAGIAGQEE